MDKIESRKVRSDSGKQRYKEHAAAQSLGLLQVITVMLAKAAIFRWSKQRVGAKAYKRSGWGLSGKAYFALERYFQVGLKKADNLANARRWIQMMAGKDKSVGNNGIKRYYMMAFGVTEDLRKHAQLFKSAESIFRNIDNAIESKQYSADDVIKLFIRKYGYERIRTALDAIMSENARHITLDENNGLDYDSITALMWRISSAYLAKTNNGKSKMSKQDIERWIEKDSDLKSYYMLVLRRMNSVIGPALDNIAAETHIRIS